MQTYQPKPPVAIDLGVDCYRSSLRPIPAVRAALSISQKLPSATGHTNGIGGWVTDGPLLGLVREDAARPNEVCAGHLDIIWGRMTLGGTMGAM